MRVLFNLQQLEHSEKIRANLIELDSWKQRSETLLYSMMPKEIATRLRLGEDPVNTCQVSVLVNISQDLSPSSKIHRLLFKLLDVDCMHHGMENLKAFITTDQTYLCTSINLNIRSLPAKYDQLRTMTSELNVMELAIDVIMICETFLNDTNMNMFTIPVQVIILYAITDYMGRVEEWLYTLGIILILHQGKI